VTGVTVTATNTYETISGNTSTNVTTKAAVIITSGVTVVQNSFLTNIGNNVVSGYAGGDSWKNGTWVLTTSDNSFYVGSLTNIFNGSGNAASQYNPAFFNNTSPYQYNGSGNTTVSGNATSAWWVQLQTPMSFNMTEYKLKGSWNNYLQAWAIVASTDGTNWVYLDNKSSTQSSVPGASGPNPLVVSLSNTNYYKYHRLLGFQANGSFFELDYLTYYGNVSVPG
jgi:hypothetical protein